MSFRKSLLQHLLGKVPDELTETTDAKGRVSITLRFQDGEELSFSQEDLPRGRGETVVVRMNGLVIMGG